MNNINGQDEYIKKAFDYAWGYFSVHATQRLQCVNFFFVASAFLVAAYGGAINYEKYPVAAAFAILGAIVTFIFHKIDFRIRKLVHLSEFALRKMEDSMASSLNIPELKILEQADNPAPGTWKYSRAFRYLYASIGFGFVLAAVFATWKMYDGPGLSRPSLALIGAVASTPIMLLFAYELLTMANDISKQRQTMTASQIVILTMSAATVACALLIAVFVYVVRG